MKFRQNQLKLIKDLPTRMSILHRIKNEKIEYKEYYRDNHWHLAPFYRHANKHIRNYIDSSNGRTFQEVLYKIKKIAGNTAPLSHILKMNFDFSDRNNEFKLGYDGWCGGYRRQCVEHRVHDGLIEVRTPTRSKWKPEKVKRTPQEHYKLRSDYRKSRKAIHKKFKPTGKTGNVQNLHKDTTKLEGYTKAERFDYMCRFNTPQQLLDRGIRVYHGPLRVSRISIPNPKYGQFRSYNKRQEPYYITEIKLIY